MEQIKIGKFIAELRKNLKMTQQQLGNQLGVSYKTVSKWETGRGMPELSTLKPLSDLLGVSINELLSGERIKEEVYIDKLEENMVKTIDYSNRALKEKSKIIYLLLIIFGLFISMSAISIFPPESSWCSIYASVGITVFLIGINLLFKSFGLVKQTIAVFVAAICSLAILLFSDYLNVKMNHQPPRFRMSTITNGNTTVYETLFYNAYKYKNDDKYHIDKHISIDDLDWRKID